MVQTFGVTFYNNLIHAKKTFPFVQQRINIYHTWLSRLIAERLGFKYWPHPIPLIITFNLALNEFSHYVDQFSAQLISVRRQARVGQKSKPPHNEFMRLRLPVGYVGLIFNKLMLNCNTKILKTYSLGVVQKVKQSQTQLIEQNLKLVFYFCLNEYRNWSISVFFGGKQDLISQIMKNKRHSLFHVV